MKRHKNILSQSEFPFLAFSVGLVLLNWPFLGILHSKPIHYVLLYIFLLWGAGVVLAFLISRTTTGKGSDSTSNASQRRSHRCLPQD